MWAVLLDSWGAPTPTWLLGISPGRFSSYPTRRPE